MPTKELNVFVYTSKIPQGNSTAQYLKTRFNKSQIIQNIIPYGNDSLLLIVDKISNNLTFARFLKLRDDAPGIINKMTRRERNMRLKTGDLIKEESHFLWNPVEGLIFGEYNYHAIRHFSFPLTDYLKQILSSNDIEIRPVADPTTFNRMKNDTELREIIVSIGQESLTNREQSKGASILGSLRGTSNNDESVIKISISKGKKKGNKLNKDKIIEISENLLSRKGDLYTLKVIGEESKYDL